MQPAFWLRVPIRLARVARRAVPLLPRQRARTADPVATRPPVESRPRRPTRLAVEVLETEAGPVVRLWGEAGVAEAGALEAALLPPAARRPGRVTFDLGGLAFVSSLAMGVLASYRRAAARAGTRVCLAPDLHPAVREALDRPVRNELAGLVGFAGRHHRHPVLGSVGAYEVAYWKLYGAVTGLLPARAGGVNETQRRS
jgi:anti-anti-sigma factor